MPMAHAHGWRSIEIGILRQELDSMARTLYLLNEPRRKRRSALLMQATSPGQRWGIRDGEIAEPARRHGGWVDMVYKFSSRFIHLSNQHDYMVRDPFQALAPSERVEMTEYLNFYHHGDLTANSTFADVIEYVPRVFQKISDNLDYYLDELEGKAR
jgi:hypothetical protein